MSALSTWFAGRSPREKRLLLVMAALAALTLLWALVIRPVGDGLSNARERHADAVERLGETQARIDALRLATLHRRVPITGGLADTVRARAEAAGFVIASLDPAGPDRVKIGIASARPGALTAWLARSEAAGILVDSATLTDNGDRTVGATLVLKVRAS
ncbi:MULTISPECIES: type II secretion system protein GspM [unclassified Sphingomonas]|uniref:type II secretion system protein GspM n=1 Tax=unclassified Sphingomonas TaxID=196159 RepID=UPI00226A08FD|nr:MULTISPECIES: type II secretion system protein GspM [unclassified Sphingomonas]